MEELFTKLSAALDASVITLFPVIFVSSLLIS